MRFRRDFVVVNPHELRRVAVAFEDRAGIAAMMNIDHDALEIQGLNESRVFIRIRMQIQTGGRFRVKEHVGFGVGFIVPKIGRVPLQIFHQLVDKLLVGSILVVSQPIGQMRIRVTVPLLIAVMVDKVFRPRRKVTIIILE